MECGHSQAATEWVVGDSRLPVASGTAGRRVFCEYCMFVNAAFMSGQQTTRVLPFECIGNATKHMLSICALYFFIANLSGARRPCEDLVALKSYNSQWSLFCYSLSFCVLVLSTIDTGGILKSEITTDFLL